MGRRISISCMDSDRCNAKLVGKLPTMLLATKPAGLDVQYECLSSGSSLVQLSVEVEGHDSFSVCWTKDCAEWKDSVTAFIFMGLGVFVGLSIMCAACTRVHEERHKRRRAKRQEIISARASVVS